LTRTEVDGMSMGERIAVGSGGKIFRFYQGMGSLTVEEMTSPVTTDLFGVHAINFTHVYAVGDAGALVYCERPSPCQAVSTGTTAPLYAVWARLDASWLATVYAVGAMGLVLRCDSSGCVPMTVPAGTPTLRGLSGAYLQGFIAVGDAGTILNYDGVSWTAVPSGTTARLNAIHGGPPWYAVGENGTVLELTLVTP
jgi:hypothetical protein